jgi:hypothetical protein
LFVTTVGKNVIATTKLQNNYGTIQSFKFPLLQCCSFLLLKAIAKRLPLLYAKERKRATNITVALV